MNNVKYTHRHPDVTKCIPKTKETLILSSFSSVHITCIKLYDILLVHVSVSFDLKCKQLMLEQARIARTNYALIVIVEQKL